MGIEILFCLCVVVEDDKQKEEEEEEEEEEEAYLSASGWDGKEESKKGG